MKLGEKGFTLLELLVAITIMVLASSAAGAAIFQILGGTERNNDHMTAVRQVENAGYWISRDTQMALSATTNLTSPNFLVLSWTTWADNGTQIYHSANYTLDLTDGIGTLKRTYASGGASEQTLIAQYIYYNADNTTADNTTKVSYESPVLTVQITALFEDILESREYKVKHRPGF